jgi:hypothetical protein
VSKLLSLRPSKLKEPLRMIVSGVEGVGKTTFAAGAPDPIWIDANAGSGKVNVARYPFSDDPKRGHVPARYEQILDAIKDLTTSDHKFKTVVFDAVDDIEKMLHKFIVDRDKPKSKEKLPGINSYGYGKGSQIALDEWRVFFLLIEELQRAKDMNVLFLSHVTNRKYKNPGGEDFGRTVMRIDDLASEFLRGRCDVVAYAYFEESVSTMFSDDRARGVDTGRRMMRFRRTAIVDAKSRYAIPDQIELTPPDPYGVFAGHLDAAETMSADQVLAQIETELARIGDADYTAAAHGYVKESKGDVERLKLILGKVRVKPSKEGSEQ